MKEHDLEKIAHYAVLSWTMVWLEGLCQQSQNSLTPQKDKSILANIWEVSFTCKGGWNDRSFFKQESH